MTGHVRALLAEVAGTFLFFFVGAGAIIATGGDNLVAIALALTGKAPLGRNGNG